MKAIEKSYPDSTHHIIEQVFKPKQGWMCANDIYGFERTAKLTRENVLKAQSEGVTIINVRLIDEYGGVRFPDFTVEELLYDKTIW